MNDELKTNAAHVDGFEDDGASEGDFIRVIQGEKWSFSNEGTWLNSEDEEISPTREVVVVDIARVLQKWIDQAPVRDATRFLAPGEKVDVKQLNEDCPKSEWSEDLIGKPRGPWQIQSVVYMVDMQTMQRFTYPTSTVGGSIAVDELKDAVKLMRRFRGAGVYPIVSPAAKHMNTRFGGRQRPHFVIKRWISFGPEGTAALPPASPPSLQPPPASPPASPRKATTAPDHLDKVLQGARIVEEPTLHEELNDAIPENW